MQDANRFRAARRGGSIARAGLLLLAGLAGTAHAASVYKCTGAQGEVAYQGVPCADGRREHMIEIEPAPAWQASPQYAVAVEHAGGTGRHGSSRAAAAPQSYECRAADGEVFYRHSGCPHSIAASAAGGAASRRSSGASASVGVSARRIARGEACREIERAGAIGRAGHEHDEVTSTYERNLGNDPCR